MRVWHSTTYRLENNLNYGLERVWALAYLKGSNKYCPASCYSRLPQCGFDCLPCQEAFIQVASVNLGQMLADASGSAVCAVTSLSASVQALAFFAVHHKLAMKIIHVSGEACSNHVCKTSSTCKHD